MFTCGRCAVVLPGLVFSSWYQRKKARFFCSLRSDPCCRSQWEIRLWLIPGRKRSGVRSESSVGWTLADTPCCSGSDLMGLVFKVQMKLILTRYLSDHGLGNPPVRQKGLNLLFDQSAVPSTSTESIVFAQSVINGNISNGQTLLKHNAQHNRHFALTSWNWESQCVDDSICGSGTCAGI